MEIWNFSGMFCQKVSLPVLNVGYELEKEVVEGELCFNQQTQIHMEVSGF